MSERSGTLQSIPHATDYPISPKIRRVLIYIHADYTLDLNLSGVGSRIGIHPNYLCRRFKKELGIGFHTYLSQYRIQKASLLLVSSFKSIKEIGYEVGFNRPEIFSKTFKRLIGCSPQIYRIRSLAASDGLYVPVVPTISRQSFSPQEGPSSPSSRFFQAVFDVEK